MITIKKDGYKLRAMILDDPVNDVSGIVQCCKCAAQAPIMSEQSNEIVLDCERFGMTHICQKTVRRK